MSKKITCPKCDKPALDKRQYKDGSALYVHEQRTATTPFGQSSEITKYCDVKKKTRVTVSVRPLQFAGFPLVNNRLMELHNQLDVAGRREFLRKVHDQGERFVVFHIDGERVSLASEQREMVAA